jgi:hypothetical protein
MWKKLLPTIVLLSTGLIFQLVGAAVALFGNEEGAIGFGAAGLLAFVLAAVFPLHDERIRRLERDIRRLEGELGRRDWGGPGPDELRQANGPANVNVFRKG